MILNDVVGCAQAIDITSYDKNDEKVGDKAAAIVKKPVEEAPAKAPPVEIKVRYDVTISMNDKNFFTLSS